MSELGVSKKSGGKGMRKIKIICFVAVVSWFGSKSARAQSEYVYLVKVFDCKSSPKCARVQTGFRVRGIKGIVTALHGVADSNDIRVIGDQAAAKFRGPLRVVKADVAHDVALLSSKEIEDVPADGLEIAEKVNWGSMGGVSVIGRPLGLPENLATALSLRRPALKALRDLVPPETAIALLDRRSPDPDQTVVSIDGVLLPGHSGAPILDSQNRVIAIGNGGLLGGPSGICWAIPWERINFTDARSNSRLAALAGLDPEILFLFEDGSRRDGIPDIYRIRITVIDQRHVPVDDAKVISSIGGEALKVPGGYQYEIAGAKRPKDGKLTFYASKESAFLTGKKDLTLEDDPNPSVAIQLSKDDSALIRGKVVDELNVGIAGARVSVAGYEAEAVITGAGGGFVLPAHAAVDQMILLHVEKDGFKGKLQYHPAGNDPVTIILERR